MSWGQNLHDVHRSTMLSSDCSTCHNSGGRFPVFLDFSSGGNGLPPISCMGCHGRDRDADLGAGLRQHHFNAGETICASCHSDSDPANYTPVGEDFLPPFYMTTDANHPNKPTDSCDPNGEEHFRGTGLGLDNDGDLAHDTADSDCRQAVCGDGNLDPGEECDDGNVANGDCCSSVCGYEAAGSSCSDSQFCNGFEMCDGAGVCQPGGDPCRAGDACNEATNSCQVQPECVIDADCSDGAFCNGAEVSSNGTCQAG